MSPPKGIPVDVDLLTGDLTLDEGYRHELYRDTKGKLTIGIGRNLTDVGLSRDEAAYLLHNDIMNAISDLDAQGKWWRDLPEPQARAMVNLCFNMGMAKLLTFVTFLDLMSDGKYDEAAADLMTTAWYREVGQRGPRMVARLKQKGNTS